MSDTNKQVIVKGGTNLFGVVGLILVILKLAGVAPVAAWSWWLVTLPFWLGLAIFLVVFITVAVVGLISLGVVALLAWWADHR